VLPLRQVERLTVGSVGILLFFFVHSYGLAVFFKHGKHIFG
jgi:hypothetical protein